MTVYAKSEIFRAYERFRSQNIERDQAIHATAQAYSTDVETVRGIVSEREAESAHA